MNVRFSKEEIALIHKIVNDVPWLQGETYNTHRNISGKLRVILESLMDGESVTFRVSHA